MLTVGHVWVKQVSSVVVLISIRAPVGFTDCRRWMGREVGDSEDTEGKKQLIMFSF